MSAIIMSEYEKFPLTIVLNTRKYLELKEDEKHIKTYGIQLM